MRSAPREERRLLPERAAFGRLGHDNLGTHLAQQAPGLSRGHASGTLDDAKAG